MSLLPETRKYNTINKLCNYQDIRLLDQYRQIVATKIQFMLLNKVLFINVILQIEHVKCQFHCLHTVYRRVISTKLRTGNHIS
jgi:hypothetical protein